MIQPAPDPNETLEEIHRTREAIAAKFGGNIAAIVEDARKRQAASGRAEWTGPKTIDKPVDESTGSHS